MPVSPSATLRFEATDATVQIEGDLAIVWLTTAHEGLTGVELSRSTLALLVQRAQHALAGRDDGAPPE